MFLIMRAFKYTKEKDYRKTCLAPYGDKSNSSLENFEGLLAVTPNEIQL